MDPRELNKLSDFSDTLTHVLAQLDAKYRELTMGSSRMFGLATVVEKHTQLIQSLEKSRDEHKDILKDNLRSQGELSREVINVTSQECAEIHRGLLDLRTSTKHELNKLQGSLQVSIIESMESILKNIVKPTDLPRITSDMPGQKIMELMYARIQSLEVQMKSQELVNQTLKKAINQDSNTQDRFDDFTIRIAQMERAIESDRKRFTKLEVHISSLYAVQNKMEQAIRLIDDKINAIVLSGGGSGGGLTLLTAEQAEILHTPIPNFTVNDDEVGPLPAARASRASVSESPKLNAMKSNLKEKRKESLRAPRSSIVSPLGQPTPILEVDEYADQSVDSQVLMDEWVVDKLELLDSIVNDQIIGRLNTQDTHRKNIDSQLHTLQETLKEMELSNDGSKAKGVSTVEYDHLKHTDKAFRAIVHEVKESWEKAYEELDKKVQKMEYIIKQIESSPDDLHKRLNSFKSKMRSLLDSLEDTNGESKDELLARLSRPLDDISREAAEISRIELELRDNVSKKAPGTPLPPSATPSRLPEHLKVAQKKSTAFIDEGIEKLTLSNRIHHLEEAIHSKVNVTSLNQLDEDLRIALTLKTDQKAFDSAIIKKASQVDLQKFREHVADEIDSMREMLVRNASSAHKMMSSMTAAPQTDSDLAERFDILYSQFQELKKGVAALVPRSEVEVALQALLDEVKAARKVFIDKESFNDRLKKKADQSELERLLSILSSSIGNPANGTAAALHKCLTCDKPLNPFGVDVDGFTNPMFHYSPSPAQDEVLPAGRALLTQGRPLSSSSMPILPPVSSGQGGGNNDAEKMQGGKGRRQGTAGGGGKRLAHSGSGVHGSYQISSK